MPSNSFAKKPSTNRLPLPTVFPTGLRCVQVYLPDDIHYVSYLLGALEKLSQQVRYDRDEAKTAKEVARLWSLANAQTMAGLGEGCQECEEPPPVRRPPKLPDCITVKNDDIYIRACDCMGNIYIYNCGCGCDDQQQQITGNGSFGPSGGSGGGSWTVENDVIQMLPADNLITPCDVVTYLIPYIVDQGFEMATWLDNNADNLSDVVDGFASLTEAVPVLGAFTSQGTDWITDLFEVQTGGFIELFGDNDFLLAVQRAFIKEHGQRTEFRNITVQDLTAITKYLPWTWLVSSGVALPRLIWDGFVRIMRMGKVNERLLLAKGQANTTLCNYLYAEANQAYLPSTVGNVLPPPGQTWTYEWVYEYDFTINSQGTPSGTGGWTSAPNTQATYVAGVGWFKGGSATNDHISRIRYTGCNGRAIVGLQVFLDAGMGGNSNLLGIYNNTAGTTIYQEAHPGQATIAVEEAFNPTDLFDVAIAEFAFNAGGGDALTKHIQKIRIYGTGTPPVDGYDVS